ncbi:hypothetical protein O0L34_g15643 [Tuta absoluta]|nr:hypothetical protein O0L34_g15643 [Tuta absoluta]
MAGVKWLSFVYAFILEILWVKSRIIPNPYHMLLPRPTETLPTNETPLDKVIKLDKMAAHTNKRDQDYLKADIFGPDDRCAILVVSNQGQTNVQQSILRKYRYNQDGDLIPGSVQYYIKFPQGDDGTAMLVPLKDKAFSPSGGFVRYYKEVPPIPQSWKR